MLMEDHQGCMVEKEKVLYFRVRLQLEELYRVDMIVRLNLYFVMTTCYVASGSDALKAIRIKFYFHMSPLEHLSLEVRQYSPISSNRTNG
jgi:hypothetical protein